MTETEVSGRGDLALAATLERGLTPAALRATRLTGRIGAEQGLAVYLVGGPVRDVLLGRPTCDIDLMVEGDCGDLARSLAAALEGDLRLHPEFLTATISVPGGLRVDLASARGESYAEPAALPAVRPGSISEDLARRDFTINALALRICPDPAPVLIDLSSGRDDLARGRLRVLHDRSFEDDPTRILRGVRFETRLDFRFDDSTEVLARATAAEGLVARLSGSRLRRELRLLLAEDGALESLDRLASLGVLRAIDPGLSLTEPVRAILGRVAEGHLWHRRALPAAPPVERWRTYLLALAWCLPGLPPARLADRLALDGAERRGLVVSREALTETGERAGLPGLAPHEVSAALAALDTEALLTLRAIGPSIVSERVEAELLRYRPLALRVRGGDLLAHGHPSGPAIGRALEATRNARLDGRIDAAAELDFALAELSRARDRAAGAEDRSDG